MRGLSQRIVLDGVSLAYDVHGSAGAPPVVLLHALGENRLARRMADDVAGLLDHLDLGAVTVLGHSLGGVVGYLLAVQRPDLVARLVVEDVCPPYRRNRPVPERPEVDLPFDWPAVLALRAEAERDDADLWRQLSTIAAPTLLVGGGPSSPVLPAKLREVAELVPDCTYVEIADGGHYVHRSQPGPFGDAVLTWLESPAG